MSVSTGEDPSTAGVVELREDIPLKPSAQRAGAGRYFTGIRFVALCFAVLSVAITLALATQIYYGDYELVPHGSVASDALACSRAGTDALMAGGGAMDAAVAAALCLAVLSPHTTGADASGTLMLYEYRSARTEGPQVAAWSHESPPTAQPPRAPCLVAALASLHRQHGRLPWRRLVEPAVQLASSRFPVSAGLAAATQMAGVVTSLGVLEAGQMLELSSLAAYLQEVANKTDEDLAVIAESVNVTTDHAMRAELGGFVLFSPLAQPAAVALVAALRQLLGFGTSAIQDEQLVLRTASSLQQALRAGGGGGSAGGVATNIAIIDSDDVYVSLVTGMSAAFGSRTMTPEGYFPDAGEAAGAEARAVPALTPLILTENYTCGYRYVLGSGDVSALVQVAAQLLAGERDLIASIERPRFVILPDSSIGMQVEHTRMFSESELKELRSVGALRNLTPPYTSCNVVQQQGDALSSHADSRGGGIAYRF